MRFDLIVVGGGHNGLVCAAVAARAGLSVAVIERHERVGGAAFTEEFHPGFRNSAASYTVSLLEPAIIDLLRLRDHGLKILPRPLDNFVPSLDGPGLELPGDPAARRAAIAGFSRRDADAWAGFSAGLDDVIRVVRPLFTEAPIEPLKSPDELSRAVRVIGRTLGYGPRALKRTVDLFRCSAGDWLDSYFETDLLKGALAFDSIVGHFASPYQRGTGYLLLHHALGEVEGRRGAWGHAVGGMGAISDALAAAAVGQGVDIRTGCAVRRISPLADGFEVESGQGTLFASRVAGAVHPRRLFLDLLQDAELPARFRKRIEDWHSESASFRINVALSELPDFSCLPGKEGGAHHGAGILFTPSIGYLDRAWDSARQSGFSDQPVVELVIPSVLDDSLAPDGCHVASLFCQHFRYQLPDGRPWDEVRDIAARCIFDTVNDYAPNFSRSIIAYSARSPVDLEQRFGLVGGDIFHGAMSLGQLYRRRPVKGYARYRTPVPGLYLCASGAHPGGGVSGVPGLNAAHAIIEDC